MNYTAVIRILHIALFAFILAAPAFGVEISPILEGKLAAFSFTYDDGAYSHYTTALPMHLKMSTWPAQQPLFRLPD